MAAVKKKDIKGTKRTFSLPESDSVKTAKKYKKTPDKLVGSQVETHEDPNRACDFSAADSGSSVSTAKRNAGKSPVKSVRKMEVQDVASLDIAQLLDLGEGTGREYSNVKSQISSNESNSEEEEWEDVEVKEECKPQVPVISKEGVDIVLEVPQLNSLKRKKKGFDVEAHIKRQINQVKRELQLLMHKVHVLGWIAHIRFVNSLLNSEILLATSLSLINNNNLYPPKYSDLGYLERIVKWFSNTITLKEFVKNPDCTGGLFEELLCQFKEKTAYSKRYFVFMMILLFRTLGLKTRLIMSFQVVPIRPKNVELSVGCDKGDNPKKCSVKPEIIKKSIKTEADKSTYFKQGNSSSLEADIKVVKKINKSESGSNSNSNKVKQVKRVVKGSIADSGETSKHFRSLPKQPKKNNKSGSKGDSCHFPQTVSEDQMIENIPISQKVKRKTEIGECSEARSSSGKVCKGEKVSSKQNLKLQKGENASHRQIGKKGKLSKGKTKGKALTQDRKKNEVISKANDSSDTDSDFVPQSLKKKKCNESIGRIDRRVLSSDEEVDSKKRQGLDVWAEVFLEAEQKWISVDGPRQKIHCINELYSRASQPVVYVIAANTDSTLKDVTKRYVPNWHSDTRKRRVDDDWWNETMWPYAGPKTPQDREEDEDISQQLLDKPLPSSISQYKDHPLYALKRHLLKFEGIYPPDAPTLGFVRGEPVYARECVVTLRSREVWFKEARVVRLKEEPYKIVKARPKYDKMSGEIRKDLPLELYGIWQTEEYIPPIAKDGKVPRNEYGNVDLFKPCMLPKGTVHLQIPALNKVAKKLGIDCAPAVVGFEFHCGASHPLLDGFVVCEEFKDILLDTWNKEVDEANKKSEEKRLKKIYDNWKRLIRGLLIREKLKIKYAFGDDKNNPKPSSSRKKNLKK